MIHRKRYLFRLYVAGKTPNSALAVANLEAFCQANLAGRHGIEIVDLFQEPKLALAHRILITPALVKLAPPPVRTIVGILDDAGALYRILGIEPAAD